MIFYIDTEFNDYKGELISMALVNYFGGDEWYEVLECASPSLWVAENVMPVLNKAPVSLDDMRKSLFKHLEKYKGPIHIIADWPDDIKHFCELLICGPGLRIHTPPLTFEIRQDIGSDLSEIKHNALEDAKALRRAALKLD